VKSLIGRIPTLLLCVATATPMFAGNIVADPGFEAWGSSGTSAVWNQNRGSGCAAPLTSNVAHDGSYSAMLGFACSNLDIISQTITTVPGTNYTFSFWFNLIIDPSQDQEVVYAPEFRASWDGNVLIDSFVTGGWEFHPYAVTATGSSTTIAFAGENLLAFTQVDTVAVESAGGSSVPEPFTASLMFSGLLAVASFRSRFSRQQS
jgi:hypothetical protein